MTRVGVALTADRIYAVTTSRWRDMPEQTFEIKWDPRAPRDAVALLAGHLGEVSAIAMSVGLAFARGKHVKLPAVAAEERRKIMTLEPDRFFAIDSQSIVVSVSNDSDLVFAADASTIESWISAFESWGPVDLVESSAYSLARGLGAGGSRSGNFELPGENDERVIVEIADGKVLNSRVAGDSSQTTKAAAVPSVRGVSPEFLPALGAAMGFDAPLDQMLLPAAETRRIRSKRRMGVVRAAVNCALALAFALAALDRSRTRVVEQEQQEIAALISKAEGPSAVQSRLAQMDAESSAAAAAGASHADPVAVLAAISRRLPHDAVAMSVRADGDDWQVDGTATHAAGVVPALDADPLLENVRFLSASSRFSDAGRTRESFSIALHAHR